MTDDIKILEAALKVLSEALDTLVTECLDDAGQPKAPEKRALMKARSMLPPYCTQALTKTQ